VRLFDARNDLPADRAILIGWVDEIEKIGCDRESEFVIGQRGAGEFFRRQRRHQPLQLIDIGDAVLAIASASYSSPPPGHRPKIPARRVEFLESG